MAHPTPDNKKLISLVLKIDGALFCLAGLFFLLKGSITEWIFIDNTTDLILGGALFFGGIASFIVASILFKPQQDIFGTNENND